MDQKALRFFVVDHDISHFNTTTSELLRALLYYSVADPHWSYADPDP